MAPNTNRTVLHTIGPALLGRPFVTLTFYLNVSPKQVTNRPSDHTWRVNERNAGGSAGPICPGPVVSTALGNLGHRDTPGAHLKCFSGCRHRYS